MIEWKLCSICIFETTNTTTTQSSSTTTSTTPIHKRIKKPRTIVLNVIKNFGKIVACSVKDSDHSAVDHARSDLHGLSSGGYKSANKCFTLFSSLVHCVVCYCKLNNTRDSASIFYSDKSAADQQVSLNLNLCCTDAQREECGSA